MERAEALMLSAQAKAAAARPKVLAEEEIATVKAGEEGEVETAAARPAREPWVLLSTFPRVVDRSGFLRVKDVSVELAPSPRVSLLSVARRVLTRKIQGVAMLPAILDSQYPYIAAVESSGGALLLCANHISDWDDAVDPQHHSTHYILCDAVSRSASAVVDLTINGHPGSIGLVRGESSTKGRGPLTVAVLAPITNCNTAELHSWSPKTKDNWVVRNLCCSRPNNTRRWGNDGTVTVGGLLCWVDLACGLLVCNPLGCDNVVRYIELPPGCDMSDSTDLDVLRNLHKTRSVGVSCGKLMFLDIYRSDEEPTLKMWSLDGIGADGDYHWVQEYTLSFADMRNDVTYAEMLPQEEVLIFAALDPCQPKIVYFLKGNLLFAIDVLDKKVVERAKAECENPEGKVMSSRSMLTWKLPPALHHRIHGGSGSFSVVKRLLGLKTSEVVRER
ncbi:hypothetical protein EJB05_49407 [Eragrostis curvula]|uniref:DUF1618 domain-containing protein n=1 Tax=Eragrostis curvula TaxID=38414 RepID=A0A5J9T491_9POAL|nr:hypothetical protein EJB05_49407 [Eragrostis curvula]